MLKLENISKYYYNSSSVTCALRKINLELNVGEFVAITGESGSGKTTLLNLLSGLDSYEDGELYYNNKPTSYFDDEDWEKYRKEEIAFIFQSYNLIDSYTVYENVLAAYLIDGVSCKEAKAKILDILKLVGLENDIHKKAIKLSGGQKQRLSIARALAKETNIIVADEPTGNLDVENGKVVLDLLKKVSKNKLVIVVTHNQSQIEPYITRRIRLHDGEVVTDEKVYDSQELSVEEKAVMKRNDLKTATVFSSTNIYSQPKKALLMLLLMLIATISTFIFIGNFKANLDESKTKEISTTFFSNLDDTRMLVKRSDNGVISSKDLNDIKVSNVLSVEKYDLITDINYYRPSDYKMIYGGGLTDPDPNTGVSHFIDSSSIVLVDNSHFMRSTSSLTEDMLACGRLPEDSYEMVVYSEDLSILNTIEVVLFKNDRKWGADNWFQYNLKIVGVLKAPTEQAYFSDDICKLMELSTQGLDIRIYYRVKNSSIGKRYDYRFYKVALDPNIGDYDFSFSASMRSVLEDAPFSDVEKNTNMLFGNRQVIECYRMNLISDLIVSKDALGISKEMLDFLYSEFENKKQFAIFSEDFAYVDDIEKEVSELGYEAISCYKVSVTGYNRQKVIIRYVNLVVSVVGIVVVNLFSILLGFAILKVKKNDYVIFKMIGMNNSLCKKINFMEILIYCLISNIILLITSIIVKANVNNQIIANIYKYIKFYDYFIVLLILLINTILLGKIYGKFLTKKVKATVLKEE